MSIKQRQKCETQDNGNEIIKMLDSIELNSFNVNESKQHLTKSNNIAKARAGRLAKKAKKIENLLNDENADSPTCHIDHFIEFAKNDGGLIEGRFRMEIWPLLAQKMPEADHLDHNFDVADRYSLQSQRSQFLTAPFNGNLLSDSRTCSESEVFDSARSSFKSDDSEDEFMQDATTSPASVSLEELQSHAEWNQVELDVHRTLARFPPNTSESERRQLQDDLIPMIVELLHRNPSFRYYQGFHDVCLTLMLALDVDNARKVGRYLVERGAFRNYLLKSLEDSALKELHLMYVILYQCDPELERRMRHSELGTLFALSWPITWFSHALHSFDQIALCFDLFLSSHALMPIYVSAALVLHRRNEIFSVEAEMPVLHHLLNHIPKTVDIEAVLERARHLFREYKPNMIQGQFFSVYEAMCKAENRELGMTRHTGTLQRTSILQRPVLIAGVAVAGVAAMYVWASRYQSEFLPF